MAESAYLTADEAVGRLGISHATLYSYVSRGLIRSEFADASRRTRRYRAEDVETLLQRREHRRDPRKAVDAALHWGGPALDSAITLIADGRLYYRGQDALMLAGTHTVEQVATLIWIGSAGDANGLFAAAHAALPSRCRTLLPHLTDSTPLERLQALLPIAAGEDLAAYDLRPVAVAQTGARLLRLAAAIVVATPEQAPTCGDSLPIVLQRAWAPDDAGAAGPIGAALILCADHELNVSSFTARCVASAGSNPYAVVSAGLAALQGVKHGGNCERVEALFRDAGSSDGARGAVSGRIRRGEGVPGFGHPLYPEGDPRGGRLLALAAVACPDSPTILMAEALIREAGLALNDRPNLDFGLVTLCAAIGLPAGSALTLFALGRMIGWIGHAIEEYRADRLIRPRAHYVGELPA